MMVQFGKQPDPGAMGDLRGVWGEVAQAGLQSLFSLRKEFNRDRDCEADKAFVRSTVYVEEHAGRIEVSHAPQGGFDHV